MKMSSVFLLLLLLGLTNTLLISAADASHHHDGRKSYIVYMGHRHEGESPANSLHMTLLQNVLGREAAQSCLLHSYKRSFNGFVAMLTEEEVEIISGLEEVVSVFPNRKNKLHTTRSWDFLGFPQKVSRAALESDVIVGVIDTGIWPESKSFSDVGLGPPPPRWKGTCQANFSCNNKIIGARYYRQDKKFGATDIMSPRDSEGHGTHCASTVAGSLVHKVGLYGLAYGTARGGVPSARVAVYKVCWSDGCYDADILAAFDDAVADGVDIISASLGFTPRDYFRDSIAIGSFHAMKMGILTSNAAGNDGPDLATITNFSPWSLSVAASTIDRKFITRVQLGDGSLYQGISINTFDMKKKMYPIIYGGDAPNTTAGFNSSISRLCIRNSLDSNLVRGKIVLCDSQYSIGPFYAGARGVILSADGPKDKADILPLPASYISLADGRRIYSYMTSTTNPTATIFRTVERNDTFAPSVASFSSRGPNPITLDIFKPDIAAPGVHIIAGWSRGNPMSEVTGDNRFVSYNILSGTSMACPHVSAVAAYVKSFHPTWSPAAIKSALMTTAIPMSASKNRDLELAYGSGHINPVRAVTPGLVYDANEADYVKFLCGQGYNTKTLQIVTNDLSTCTAANNGTAWNLNYPAFTVTAPLTGIVRRTFTRTVTNVGSASSVYKSRVVAPLGVKISVSPSKLRFTSVGQKKSYRVRVKGVLSQGNESASLTWDDGTFQVRSPIVMFTVG